MSPCHRCRFSRCNSPRCGSIEAGGEVFPPNKKCQPTHPGVCNVYRTGAHGRWTCWILDDSGFFSKGETWFGSLMVVPFHVFCVCFLFLPFMGHSVWEIRDLAPGRVYSFPLPGSNHSSGKHSFFKVPKKQM